MSSKKKKTAAFLLRLDPEMIRELDAAVDGIHYRSRTHLVQCIIWEWLKKQPLR